MASYQQAGSLHCHQGRCLLLSQEVPSAKILVAIRAARNDARRVALHRANSYWPNLCQHIQRSADTGNVHGMHEGMKKAFGPSAIKTIPLNSAKGEIIKDRSKQIEIG